MILRADCGRDAAADWGLEREADVVLLIPSSGRSVFPSPSPSRNLLPLLCLPVDFDIRTLVVPWAATLSSLSSRASLFLLNASLASLCSCFLRNADTSLSVSTAMWLILLDEEDLRGLHKDFLPSRSENPPGKSRGRGRSVTLCLWTYPSQFLVLSSFGINSAQSNRKNPRAHLAGV